MNDEVISAISTPAGTGGVAIIRMSGADALKIAERIFAPVGKTEVARFQPNRMYAGSILCEGFKDFGLCVYFKAPASFTGEDVVELHCHGGAQIARGVLKATLAHGARAATGGEFTKRAFVNGKLSLSSAEGMIDMINAESLAEVRAGGLLYRERLTREVQSLQSRLCDLLAGIAADVDYPEEGIRETQFSSVREQLIEVREGVIRLASGYDRGRLIKSGVTVAICGAPNVGKSSLLNALLGYDKAIVSSQAGTTRDAVEGSIQIDGVKYNFIDTAGIRDGAGEVESIGIERAKSALKSADVVLCVSPSGDFSAAAEAGSGKIIKVFSKTDLTAPHGDYDAAVSATTGSGVEELKSLIASAAVGGQSLESEFVIEERHFSALNGAARKLTEAIDGAGNFPLDLLSMDIHAAWEILGEITGETANEDIISTVFAKFCVGK